MIFHDSLKNENRNNIVICTLESVFLDTFGFLENCFFDHLKNNNRDIIAVYIIKVLDGQRSISFYVRLSNFDSCHHIHI